MGSTKRNASLSTSKMQRFRLIPRMLKVSSGHFLSIVTFYSVNGSISRQRRPWSDCTDAQADLGLRCLHTLKDMFLHCAAKIMLTLPCKKYRSCYVRKHTFQHVPQDSNQPAHMKKLCILGYPKYARWRFCSDGMNAQADLNLCSAHMSHGTFSDDMAHIYLYIF